METDALAASVFPFPDNNPRASLPVSYRCFTDSQSNAQLAKRKKCLWSRFNALIYWINCVSFHKQAYLCTKVRLAGYGN